MDKSESQDRVKMFAVPAMKWIRRHWPRLCGRIPAESRLFSIGFGYCEGMSSMPELANKKWFTLSGGQLFSADPTVPDGFFAVGLRNRSASEWLIAMWREGERRFWLCDQYVVFYPGSRQTTARTAKRLEAALERWDTGKVSCILKPR